MCVAEENGWRMGGCWLDLVALPVICLAGKSELMLVFSILEKKC